MYISSGPVLEHRAQPLHNFHLHEAFWRPHQLPHAVAAAAKTCLTELVFAKKNVVEIGAVKPVLLIDFEAN